jgi:hypothetical protein
MPAAKCGRELVQPNYVKSVSGELLPGTPVEAIRGGLIDSHRMAAM